MDGHLEIVKFFVKNGPNVNAWNNYSLRWAAEEDHFEVVEYLKSILKKKKQKNDI
jgi:ankyrin repeat protein